MLNVLANSVITNPMTRWLYGLLFDLDTRRGFTPLVVYQMGKVGSNAVLASLKRAKLGHLHHAHFLTAEAVARFETEAIKSGHTNYTAFFQSMYSRMLAEKLASSGDQRWNIISLTRDPIATFLSQVFFAPRFHGDILDEAGVVDLEKAQNYVLKSLTKFDHRYDWISNWFQNEFEASLQIDAYAQPFDHQRQFSIIGNEKFKVLILKLEHLSDTIEEGVNELMGASYSLVAKNENANTGENASRYQDLKRQLSLPADLCRRVYSTPYVQHFYSTDEIEAFIERWS